MKQMYDAALGVIVSVPDDWSFADLAKSHKQAGRMAEADPPNADLQAERMQTERLAKRRGRPMIGDRPLTAAEKKARWRAKKKLL